MINDGEQISTLRIACVLVSSDQDIEDNRIPPVRHQHGEDWARL